VERNAYFDNAKLMLIFLVVFGHVIQPFVDGSQGMNTLYLWIYTFHMPAFIFLSGFFAKGSGNRKYITKLAQKLLFPYMIFQLIYTGYYFLIGKDGWQLEMFYPHWSLWFLFSLFSWHILLIWFKKIPAAMGLAISVGIGLIVGYFGEVGHTFSLSRTFVFFPFFLMGYWLTQNQVMWLKQIQLKAAAVVVMMAVAVGIYFAPDFNTGWLLASKSYSTLGLPEYGIIARLLVYVTSVLMMASVLAWIPEKRSRLTVLGTRTLYVYLLHGFFVQFFREADLFAVNHVIDLLGLAVMSALIVLVLSSRPIQGIWQPLIEGRMSILKNKFMHSRKQEQQYGENA
jgi:fucose 4-O-acetylase-like acetyltransferase